MEERLRKIKAFAFDVDGVLTDGSVLVGLDGEFYRTFNEKDLFALRMASMNSYILGIITGGSSQCISAGLSKCGIKNENIFMKSRNKVNDFNEFCRRNNLLADEIMFFGDDNPDLEVIRLCGIGVCPADAADDIREVADIIASKDGGKGCVREILEKTMKIQNLWNFHPDNYRSNF